MEKIVKCPMCGLEFEYIDGAPVVFCPNCGFPIAADNEDNPSKYDNPDNL